MRAGARHARRWAVLLVTLLACLGAGACGGGSDGGADTPGAPDCPAAPADVVAPDGAVDAAAPDTGGPPASNDVGAPPDAPGPAALSATEWLFDDDATPRRIEIAVAPDDWAWLQANATREEYVPATVTVADEVGVVERCGDAAVRFKGAYGSLYACFAPDGERLCPKLSLKVSFNREDRAGRCRGVRKFVLNSCNRDPSCLHERLTYSLFRDAGVEASRAVHVSVRVNDEPAGFFLLVEEVDHEFLEDHFDDPSGNLYKEVWPQYETPEPYLAALETNEEEADVARLVALARLLRSADVTAAPERLDPWFDRDTLRRYLVVDQLSENWDGVWKFYCSGDSCGNHNFFLYDDPATGRFFLVPWDLDHTFGRPNRDLARSWWDDGPEACELVVVNEWASVRAPQCDPLLRAALRGDWAAWRETLRALTSAPDAPLARDRVLARLDRYRAQLGPLVAGDPAGPGLDAWRRAAAELRQVVREQYREVERFLAEPDVPGGP